MAPMVCSLRSLPGSRSLSVPQPSVKLLLVLCPLPGTCLPHSLLPFLPATHLGAGRVSTPQYNSWNVSLFQNLWMLHILSYQRVPVCDQDLPDDWILSPYHAVPSTQDSAWHLVFLQVSWHQP